MCVDVWVYFFPPPAGCTVRVYLFSQSGNVRHPVHPVTPVREWIEMPMPEAVWYRNKRTQSGNGLRCWVPEYWCWRHWSRCQCPAMVIWYILLNGRCGDFQRIWPAPLYFLFGNFEANWDGRDENSLRICQRRNKVRSFDKLQQTPLHPSQCR